MKYKEIQIDANISPETVLRIVSGNEISMSAEQVTKTKGNEDEELTKGR